MSDREVFNANSGSDLVVDDTVCDTSENRENDNCEKLHHRRSRNKTLALTAVAGRRWFQSWAGSATPVQRVVLPSSSCVRRKCSGSLNEFSMSDFFLDQFRVALIFGGHDFARPGTLRPFFVTTILDDRKRAVFTVYDTDSTCSDDPYGFRS